MRRLFLSLIVLVIGACHRDMQPIALELDDGNVITEQNWRGKWVYINYWAHWCKPCAEEIPELNAFAEANDDVLVLGVNFDKVDNAVLLKQISAMHIEFSVVTNDIQKVFGYPLPQGLPSTIVVNPQGQVINTLTGPQTAKTLAAAKTQ